MVIIEILARNSDTKTMINLHYKISLAIVGSTLLWSCQGDVASNPKPMFADGSSFTPGSVVVNGSGDVVVDGDKQSSGEVEIPVAEENDPAALHILLMTTRGPQLGVSS